MWFFLSESKCANTKMLVVNLYLRHRSKVTKVLLLDEVFSLLQEFYGKSKQSCSMGKYWRVLLSENHEKNSEQYRGIGILTVFEMVALD